jgi:small ligand-binding sensory domain FIST
MMDGIRFVSGSVIDLAADDAVASLLSQIKDQWDARLQEAPPHLAIVFLSAHFTSETEKIAAELRSRLNPQVLIGCTAEAVIGREHEIEDRPAITLFTAHLPGVSLAPFLLQMNDWGPLLLDPAALHQRVGAPGDTRLFIMIGDPFSAPMDDVVQAFNNAYPGIPIVGGMASGALRQFGNALILGDQVHNQGAVGVALAGAIDVDVVLSQACRPIWRPFTVTAAQKNTIFSLEGKPPMAWIQDLIQELSEEERALMQNGMFVGRAVRGTPESLGSGDFLIRGVIGVDRQSGAIAIADSVIDGEVIQFHLRDALAAQEDLEMTLIPQMFCEAPGGALLFSCNGRGTKLYDHPDGDISVVRKNLGDIPLAGFFCAGEIGPIGGQNYMHGHTASMAIFRPMPGV